MKKNALLFIVFMIPLFISCIEEVDIDFGDKDVKPVVSCVLRNANTQYLDLTWSKKIHSGFHFKEIKEAKISLFENNEFIGNFEKVSYAKWKIEYRPKVGMKYKLEIDIPEYPKIFAETSMPGKARARHFMRYDEQITDFKNFTMSNPDDPIWIYVMKSSFIDPKYGVSVRGRLEDDKDAELEPFIYTNHPDVDKFNQRDIGVKMRDLYSFPNYARIYNNENKFYPKAFQIATQAECYFIMFRSCSKEYDNYLKTSIEKKKFYESEYNPLSSFDENVVYSNIENGLGIFGAYSEEEFFFYYKVYLHF